jgi:hypothetical protein
MKYKKLFIQENNNKICRCTILNEYTDSEVTVIFKEDLYELNDNQLKKIENVEISKVFNMSKIEFFEKYDIEELIV